MTPSHHTIEWRDAGHEPQCQPDPAYPNGKDVDFITPHLVDGWPTCKVSLPYPAKRCGVYLVSCEGCGSQVGVTTAGRPDDPRSVVLPCRKPDVLQ